ncbi:hypothetical protein EJB05_48954 [Eragrostis curvula]|uniref:Cyanobacterial aminoacyl-tRNA synthetase CAAD domain-containing protein n=1 Tax=Eragrostis curvula TaxID=38414 RepID=A0A5J9T5K5_9POAL|nr:hypothetical protein EJB05_48954 [Eragrostis curvula]
MVAAAAARPVSVRRLSARSGAPVTGSLPASRVAAPFPRRADSLKISQCQFTARYFQKENSSVEVDELLDGIKEKVWDAMENKSSLLLYAGGVIFTVWLSSAVIRAVGSVPLVPDLLELIGLGYSGWFVYRYLLFQENRQELASNLDALKKRITGSDE